MSTSITLSMSTCDNSSLSLYYTFNDKVILYNMQARVNIPGLSSRKIQKDIAAGEFTSTPEIQVSIHHNSIYSNILLKQVVCILYLGSDTR